VRFLGNFDVPIHVAHQNFKTVNFCWFEPSKVEFTIAN